MSKTTPVPNTFAVGRLGESAHPEAEKVREIPLRRSRSLFLCPSILHGGKSRSSGWRVANDAGYET